MDGSVKQEALARRQREQVMLTRLGRLERSGSLSGDEAAFLEAWRSLPRFDARKQEMLSLFSTDKSCKWLSTYTQDC